MESMKKNDAINSLIQEKMKPELSSEELGWKSIRPSTWINMKPQAIYVPSSDKYIVAVHLNPQPVKMVKKTYQYHHEGYAHAGEINVTSAGEESYCAWDRDFSFLRLEIASFFLQEIAEQTNFSYTQQIELAHAFRQLDPKMLQISQWILDEFKNGGRNGLLYFDSLANLLGIHLLQKYTMVKMDPSQPDTLKRTQISCVFDFIQTNYKENFTLGELSVAVQMSPAHLGRLFKKATQLTPHQYLIKIRIDHAKQLLLQQELTIGEIAASVGFFDQSHFYRYFKREVGLSPKEYRSQII